MLEDFVNRGQAAQTEIDLILRRRDYCETIADRFCILRGRGIALSSTDAALVEQWFSRGVPLWMVCAVLDELENRPRRLARIRHLSYLEDEIEARFAEWRAFF